MMGAVEGAWSKCVGVALVGTRAWHGRGLTVGVAWTSAALLSGRGLIDDGRVCLRNRRGLSAQGRGDPPPFLCAPGARCGQCQAAGLGGGPCSLCCPRSPSGVRSGVPTGGSRILSRT